MQSRLRKGVKYRLMRWIWLNASELSKWAGRCMIKWVNEVERIRDNGDIMKKRFGIERKLITPMLRCFYNEWRLWRKYVTEKQRDEAFKAVSSNRFMWEYRKINL